MGDLKLIIMQAFKFAFGNIILMTWKKTFEMLKWKKQDINFM